MKWPGVHIPHEALLVVTVLYLLYIFLPCFRYDGTSVTVPDHVNIDEVIRGDWNYDPGPLRFLPASCIPQSNLVFIRCIHCSTGDVDMVFRRFGYVNNLSVVLPVGKRMYLGWPRPISVDDFYPSSLGYNLLTESAIYNGTVMRGLMNNKTVFFAMIRHPLNLLVSTLHSFHMLEAANLTNMHGITALQTYLRNIDKYDSMFKNQTASPDRPCIPDGFSLTKNLLSHCLGMPLGFPKDREDISTDSDAVSKYIRKLDTELLLVMIMEYADESLILLKRLMCWSFKDILHLSSSVNSEGSSVPVSTLPQHDHDLHRQWSSADYQLYDHFNRTFWEKVDRHGEDFWEDLVYYRYLQGQVRWFCQKVRPYGNSYIQFPDTKVSPGFSVTSEDCGLMEAPLLDMLKERYLQQESQLMDSSTDMSTGNLSSGC